MKLLKLYYNLCYKLLPSYFDCYLEVIGTSIDSTYNLRPDVRPLIRLPRTRLVFTESSVLFQLIKLINETDETYPEILTKIEEKSHTYLDLDLILPNFIFKGIHLNVQNWFAINVSVHEIHLLIHHAIQIYWNFNYFA